MNYSLWMLKDLFADCVEDLHCENEQCEIRDFRLYTPGMPIDPAIAYIGTADAFRGDGDLCVLVLQEGDFLRLSARDTASVMNRILEQRQYYEDWEAKCRRIIRQGESLGALLDLAEELLGDPLLIIDDSQFLIAHSSGLPGKSDAPDMRYMLDNKSLPEETLRRFNQRYSDTFTATGTFFIPEGYFPTPSWCHQIFLDGVQAATLILARPLEDHFCGLQHLFEQVVPFVQVWIQQNRAEDSDNHFNASFARLLDGNTESMHIAQRGLSLRGWNPDCPKQLIAATALSEQFHFDAYLAQALSRRYPGIYALPFQKTIIILNNLEISSEEETSRVLRELMQEYLYYGAASMTFDTLDHVTEALTQAMEVLRCSDPAAGHLYSFQEGAVAYLTRLSARASALPALHPLVPLLRDYDRLHHTDYYKTLFCFLRNERSGQLTSKELYIHRNTLLQRLAKIEELWHPDLESPKERFYLLHSFYREYYQDKKLPAIDRPSPAARLAQEVLRH